MPIEHMVVLVPGFMGFDHFGGYPYFAQVVPASLEMALSASEGWSPESTAVVPTDTIPAGSLQARQTKLGEQLRHALGQVRKRDGGQGRAPAIHLVGHSTGAVDAELLLASSHVDGSAWTKDEETVRHAIRSVVALAGPMAGTNLAGSPLARLLATTPRSKKPWDLRDWWREHVPVEGFKEIGTVLRAVWDLGPRDAAIGQFLAGSLDDLHPVVRFVESLFKDRDLLHDLHPEAMLAVQEKLAIDAKLGPVRKARFLTVARNAPGHDPAAELFKALYTLTAADAQPAPPARVLDALDRLPAGIEIIGDDHALPKFTAATSDGIVTTARQIPLVDAQSADPLRDVKAIVVADHLDVLGGFPMTFAPRESAANGFLNSGSNFRAPELARLYALVAKSIADVR